MICQLANDIIIQFYATDKSKPLLYFLTFPSIFPPLPPLKWLNIWVWVGKKRICYRIYKTYPLFSVRWNSIRFCMLSDRQETKYLRKEAVLWSVVQERETEISVSALPSTVLQVPFDYFFHFYGQRRWHTKLSGGNGLSDMLKQKLCLCTLMFESAL